MLHGAFFSATVILAVFTLLPLWRYEAWWVRALDFPRLQLAIIALLLAVSGFFLLNLSMYSTWCALAITVFCFIYQARCIVPYTRFFPVEVKSPISRNKKRMIKIMTANVLTSNRNSEGLLGLVRKNNPDVLVTLESDDWWQSRLDELESEYPFAIKCPLDNLYGMHVYSKIELTNSQIEYLVEPDIPSIHTMVTLHSGQKIRMHFLHPTPPSPTQNKASKERDAELIIVARSVAESTVPVIVTGDLNDVAWSETTRLFRKISGLLDPRVGRGMYNTYNANYWFMRWPLDHLFHSSQFSLSKMQRLEGFGSDHFALLTELVYEDDHQLSQAGLDANQDDFSWAKEKSAAKNVSKADVPEPEKQ